MSPEGGSRGRGPTIALQRGSGHDSVGHVFEQDAHSLKWDEDEVALNAGDSGPSPRPKLPHARDLGKIIPWTENSMNPDQATQQNPEAAGRHEEYLRIASEIAQAPVRSRAGFGAFRHFEGVFWDSLRLVLDSSYFSPRQPNGPWPIPVFDPEFWHFFGRRHWITPRAFIESVLTSPASFSPNPLWALFWALAKAEHEFLHRYIPYWSHEERLTGHLVSQLIERLESFSSHWIALNASADRESSCRIWYADTATARREAMTGADLGLIVQAKFGPQEEFFKVARFQSKKVGRNGTARIDIEQVEALLHRQKLGYYLFYHPLDRNSWSLAPTVRSASDFQNDLEQARQQQKGRHSLGEISKPVNGNGFDLGMFVTFALADAASDHGVLASTASEAVAAVMDAGAPASRVLVVTLGEGTTPVQWNAALGEWIGYQFIEE